MVITDAPEGTSTPAVGTATAAPSSTAKLKVERAPNALYSAHVTVRITHPSRNELDVQLTSPSGKTVTLYNQPKAKGANLTVSMDVSAAFRNLEANGDWSVHVRDTKTGNVGKLDWMTLRLAGF
jgi:subtilisin-like proprotein convertase family protein